MDYTFHARIRTAPERPVIERAYAMPESLLSSEPPGNKILARLIPPEHQDGADNGTWLADGFYYTHDGRSYTIKEILFDQYVTTLVTAEGSALGDFWAAPYGCRFGIYPSGAWLVGEIVGRESNPDDRPIVWIPCPGIENIDIDVWAIMGNAEWDRERQVFVLPDGRCFEDDGDLVRAVCAGGEVAEEVEWLRHALIHEYDLVKKIGQ
ncbi:hypothetical protein RJ40_11935 [Methanofollis aquaemaris]|uniref:Uncharacterized protein n=1 Tax=Methanofollis aquaemaris TaxID=126734 RepID=A0A8A3S924_9EURY|nr:hypothetical protein [Methanofollis aquaemaris]QSZ68151.1 hypothetical protein RJ40_11935 [Methanofollis aquaemaris]